MVFQDSKAGEFINNRFTCLRVLGNQEEGKELRQNYNVRVYPTVLVLNNNGIEIDRLCGFQGDKDSWLKTLTEYSEGKNTQSRMGWFLMADYPILPFDPDIGFPQTVHIDIEGLSYAITYRFNGHDDKMTLTIVRELDDGIMFHGRVVPLNMVMLLNLYDYFPRYALLPVILTKEEILIYLMINVEENWS